MSTLTVYDFNGVQIEAASTSKGVVMSDEQIGVALGYADPDKSIRKIIERNADELEGLATSVNLTRVEGGREVTRSIRVWGQMGIVAITFLAKTPKAVEFRKWARETLFGDKSGNRIAKHIGVGRRAVQRVAFAHDTLDDLNQQIQSAIIAGGSDLVVDQLARTLVTESKELAAAYRAAHKSSPNYRPGGSL